jgi:plasmid stability protein
MTLMMYHAGAGTRVLNLRTRRHHSTIAVMRDVITAHKAPLPQCPIEDDKRLATIGDGATHARILGAVTATCLHLQMIQMIAVDDVRVIGATAVQGVIAQTATAVVHVSEVTDLIAHVVSVVSEVGLESALAWPLPIVDDDMALLSVIDKTNIAVVLVVVSEITHLHIALPLQVVDDTKSSMIIRAARHGVDITAIIGSIIPPKTLASGRIATAVDARVFI